MTDIEPKIMEAFLDFLFTGHLEELLTCELMIVADRYDVKALANACAPHIVEKLTVENAIQMLTIADNFKLEFLTEEALMFCFQNRKAFIGTDDWDKVKEIMRKE